MNSECEVQKLREAIKKGTLTKEQFRKITQ